MGDQADEREKTGDEHPWWHYVIGALGALWILATVVWFLRAQYFDPWKVCDVAVTAGQSPNTTRTCKPLPPTAVAPALLFGVLLLSPFIDAIDLPGVAKIARRTKKVEEGLDTNRAAVLEALVLAPAQLPSASTASERPDVSSDLSREAAEVRLLEAWSVLEPARLARTYTKSPGFLDAATQHLEDKASGYEMNQAEKELVARLQAAGLRDVHAVVRWADRHRAVLDLLRDSVASVTDGRASTEDTNKFADSASALAAQLRSTAAG